MREVVVVPWCDGDHGEDRVPATAAHVIAIDDAKPREIDLCESCDKVIADLATLLERGVEVVVRAAGQKYNGGNRKVTPGGPYAGSPMAPDGKPHPCPLCDWVSIGEGALRQHYNSKHRGKPEAEGYKTLVRWREGHGGG